MLAKLKKIGKKFLRTQSLMVAAVILIPITLYVNGPGYRLAIPMALELIGGSFGATITCDVEGTLIGKSKLRNLEFDRSWRLQYFSADNVQIKINWLSLLTQSKKCKWLKKLTFTDGEIESFESFFEPIAEVFYSDISSSTSPTFTQNFGNLLNAELDCKFDLIRFFNETELTDVHLESKRKKTDATMTFGKISINPSSATPIATTNKTIPIQWNKKSNTYTSNFSFPEWGFDVTSITAQGLKRGVYKATGEIETGGGSLSFETIGDYDLFVFFELSVSKPIQIEKIQLVDILYQLNESKNPGITGKLLASNFTYEASDLENPETWQIQSNVQAEDLRYGPFWMSDFEGSWAGDQGSLKLNRPDIQVDIEAELPLSESNDYHTKLTLNGEVKISGVETLLKEFDIPLSISGPLLIEMNELEFEPDDSFSPPETGTIKLTSNQLAWKGTPFTKSSVEWTNGYVNGEFTCIESIVFTGNPTAKTKTTTFKSDSPAWMPEFLATIQKSNDPKIISWKKVDLFWKFNDKWLTDFSYQFEDLNIEIEASPAYHTPTCSLNVNCDIKGETRGKASSDFSILLQGKPLTTRPPIKPSHPVQGQLTIIGENLKYNTIGPKFRNDLHPVNFGSFVSGKLTFKSSALAYADIIASKIDVTSEVKNHLFETDLSIETTHPAASLNGTLQIDPTSPYHPITGYHTTFTAPPSETKTLRNRVNSTLNYYYIQHPLNASIIEFLKNETPK